MTRKARLLTAIKRQPTDHCPHATYNIHPYSANAHVMDPSYADILKLIRSGSAVTAKSEAFGCTLGLSSLDDDLTETAIECYVDKRRVTTTVHTPMGDLVNVTHVHSNEQSWVVKHYISSDEDVERLLSLPYNPPTYNIDTVRALHESIGDQGIVFVNLPEPMYEVASLFHYEDFCLRTLTDLTGIKRMIDWAFERCIENTKVLTHACAGMDCVFHSIGPELCTPPMLSPAIFAELVTPYLRELIEIVHDAGMLTAIHCHGRVREVFSEILKTGVDLLEPIEPLPQGDMTLTELLTQASESICLMGHIQDQDFYSAPAGYMRQRVEEIAGIVDGRSGYILSSTCTPFDHPCTEIYKRNYLEWLTAAQRLF